jgi:hypothetical protein
MQHHNDITGLLSPTRTEHCETIVWCRQEYITRPEPHTQRHLSTKSNSIYDTNQSHHLILPYLTHHQTNLTQNASQRRRFIRQRPHRGPRHRARQLRRRALFPPACILAHRTPQLTPPAQTTLQHAKTNVAPMPTIEKGEGTMPPAETACESTGANVPQRSRATTRRAQAPRPRSATRSTRRRSRGYGMVMRGMWGEGEV